MWQAWISNPKANFLTHFPGDVIHKVSDEQVFAGGREGTAIKQC